MKIQRFLGITSTLILLAGCGSRHAHEHVKRPGPLDASEQKAIKEALKSHKIGNSINDVPVEKLPVAQEYFMQLGWTDLERKVMLRRIKLSKDHEEIERLMMQHGELELAESFYEKAKAIFATYKQLYPGGTNIKRVLYGELIAHVELLRSPDRDQSATKTAIGLARHYVEEFPDDELYLSPVIALLVACYERLLTSELLQARFYARRFEIDQAPGALVSVERRLRALPELVLKDLALFVNRYKPVLKELDSYTQQPAEDKEAPVEKLHKRWEVIIRLLGQLEQQLYFAPELLSPKQPRRRL